MIESVYTHQTDLGVSRIVPTRSNIESRICIHKPFIVALPKDHILTSKSTIKLEDFENQSLIMYSAAWKPFYDLLTQTFDKINVKPDYVIFESSTVNILSLVNVNFGVALVPKNASTFKLDNVIYRELDSSHQLDNILYLIWRRDHNNEAFHMILNKILAQNMTH